MMTGPATLRDGEGWLKQVTAAARDGPCIGLKEISALVMPDAVLRAHETQAQEVLTGSHLGEDDIMRHDDAAPRGRGAKG